MKKLLLCLFFASVCILPTNTSIGETFFGLSPSYSSSYSGRSTSDPFNFNKNNEKEEELTPEEKERKKQEEEQKRKEEERNKMIEAYKDLQFASPVPYISYGVIPDRKNHVALDMPAPLYSPVVACEDGYVEKAVWAGNYGKIVYLKHDKCGLQTRYAHLAMFEVKTGDPVKKGDVIGYVGITGRSFGPHVHFEICKASGYCNGVTQYKQIPNSHMRYIMKCEY